MFESNAMAINLKKEAFHICFPKNNFPENFKLITGYKLPKFRICAKIKKNRDIPEKTFRKSIKILSVKPVSIPINI